MLCKVLDVATFDKIRPLFSQIRFYIGRTVFQGHRGCAFVDNTENPRFAVMHAGSFCYINGEITREELKEIADEYLRPFLMIVPGDGVIPLLEEVFDGELKVVERYSIRKDPVFDKQVLRSYVDSLPEGFRLVAINGAMAKNIVESRFLNLTEDYDNKGVGYCCMYGEELVGVASSNVIYDDGIEVNIQVKPEYQRKGIAQAMAARLILRCLELGKTVSWDAMNMGSVKLSEKLGFVYDSSYRVYRFLKR